MTQTHDFSDLKALFFNGTLSKSPAISNTDGLIAASVALMEKLGASAEVIRTIDRDIATGIYPDMRRQMTNGRHRFTKRFLMRILSFWPDRFG